MGLGPSVLAAADRPANARGSATTLAVSGSFGYALPSVQGLELRADVGGGVIAPRSFFATVGARYAFAPLGKLYVGPELMLGAFVPIGGDKKARFLAVAAPTVGYAVTSQLSVEAHGDVAYAAGGTGGLLLVGGGARAWVRF